MSPLLKRPVCILVLILALLAAGSTATAATLQVPEEAPFWMHTGAMLLLVTHIAGGAIGIASGVVASTAKKGQRLHRSSGRIFYGAMFISYLIAGGVAPFIADGRRPNFIAAILALYLLLSGVNAARRRTFTAGAAEKLGLGVALLVTAMGLTFAYLGAQSDTGTIDGSPPQAFVIFVIAGLAALGGEINALVRTTLSPLARQRRHLWRMSASFFIASGSFFLGQSQVFPAWFNDSLLPPLLAFLPLFVMVYWLFRLRDRAVDNTPHTHP
ncbi:MAG: hypothetical protein AAGG11_14660 [Pseudomonadota bacterium]